MAKKTIKVSFNAESNYVEVNPERVNQAHTMVKTAMKDVVRSYEMKEAGSKVYASKAILNCNS